MAKFLTTLEASAKIEKIIREAHTQLTLITPFLQLSELFLTRLKDADRKGVKIKLIYGKAQLAPEEYSNLNGLKNLELRYCESLHAKCYFNDNQMVLTSLNLYDYSIKNNREMGIYIRRDQDQKLFNDALTEADSIIHASKLENIGVKNQGTLKKVTPSLTGYCIRYHEEIPLNANRPLCNSCYKSWVKFGDPDYPEKYCHACGEETKTSYRKPLCKKCDNPKNGQLYI